MLILITHLPKSMRHKYNIRQPPNKVKCNITERRKIIWKEKKEARSELAMFMYI